jgi:hypothetical protein
VTASLFVCLKNRDTGAQNWWWMVWIFPRRIWLWCG